MHSWQSPSVPSPLAFPHRPDGQGRAALVPSGQYAPRKQRSHAVAPFAACSIPTAQGAQRARPPRLDTVPGLHGVGSAAPVPHDAPAGHGKQSSALSIDRLSRSIVAFW